MTAYRFTAPIVLAYLFAALLLSNCASLPRSHPTAARVVALPVQPGDTGFYFSDEDKAFIVSEGIPDFYFISTKRGWYLSKLKAEEAADLRDKLRNP